MKKTRLVLFFCLIFTFLTLIPNCVFAAGNDLIDDISNMFVPKKEYHQQQKVILGGIPVGISLNNDCVEIVGFSQIIADEGAFSPACDAGLQIGDKITHINGQKITKTEQISQFAENSKILKVSFLRNGQKNQTEI